MPLTATWLAETVSASVYKLVHTKTVVPACLVFPVFQAQVQCVDVYFLFLFFRTQERVPSRSTTWQAAKGRPAYTNIIVCLSNVTYE